MELLNLLEERVQTLVARNEHLRAEVKRIQTETSGSAASLQALQEENRILKESLAQEQRLKDEVLERIDTLLEKLKDIESDA